MCTVILPPDDNSTAVNEYIIFHHTLSYCPHCMEPDFHCSIHKIPQPVLVQSHINPFYAVHFIPWRSVLILYSHLLTDLPSGLFPSCFPIKTLCVPFLFSMRAQCSAHLIILDLFTLIFPEECRLWNFSLFSLLHYPVTVFLLGSHIFLNVLFSNTLNLCFTVNIGDQVSNQYENRQRYSFSKINLYFWTRNRKTEHSGPNGNKLSPSSICSSFLLEYNFHLLVVFPKYLNFTTFLKDLRHKHILVFSAFRSILILLLVNIKSCVFFFIVVCYHPANWYHQREQKSDLHHSIATSRGLLELS